MSKEVSPDKDEAVVVDTEGNRLVWNLEEEIAIVIKTRVALGIDFYGKEKAFSEELIKRKKEDNERLKEPPFFYSHSLTFSFSSFSSLSSSSFTTTRGYQHEDCNIL
ncbi:hypothetical protein LWI29_009802 [Acer saccharum]|uniref:Uncharacterized protein n=1 Tax=Acer saccharum TaxID=4024 RepID=A0AA39RD60_ACESA|nr:hypothetical protein LWI29_009802 [Acer saccharum]